MICAIAVAEARFVNAVERGPVDVSAIPDTRKSLVSVCVCARLCMHACMLDKFPNCDGYTVQLC